MLACIFTFTKIVETNIQAEVLKGENDISDVVINILWNSLWTQDRIIMYVTIFTTFSFLFSIIFGCFLRHEKKKTPPILAMPKASIGLPEFRILSS